jgi:tripartite-type tricarboxylate transporter receptor subunit TctC
MTSYLKILLALVAAAFTSLSVAQDPYPGKRPIRLVVAFPPGGSTDVIARVLAQKLSTQMGTAVIVENKAGAAGNIGTEFVARSTPDGYTLLFNTSAPVLSIALGARLPYNVLTDFEPIALVASVPLVLTVTPSLPVSNVREFVDHLKARPGKLAYGSAGAGNITHLGSLMFLEMNGLSALHVPYKGASPALSDTIGGQVQFATSTIVSSAPLVKGGQLRGLAVTSLKRSALLPDIPTLAESGMPGFEVGAWYGILAPAKTPAPIVNRLNAEIRKALQEPEIRARLVAEGAEIFDTSAVEYSKYMSMEIQRWSELAKRTGLKVEQ